MPTLRVHIIYALPVKGLFVSFGIVATFHGDVLTFYLDCVFLFSSLDVWDAFPHFRITLLYSVLCAHSFKNVFTVRGGLWQYEDL